MDISINNYKIVSKEELFTIKGGKKINWGAVGGSCVKGAILGIAFGNPVAGCLGSAAFNAGIQKFT